MRSFIEELSSSAPTPGGGGASALIGALSSALCNMVVNLTTGKKKYAAYQDKLDEYIVSIENMTSRLLEDIEKDAKAFAPLAAAYSMDKDTTRYEEIMEEAILNAATAPMEITHDIYNLVPIIEELEVIGSRLAISDVAVAATAARAALEGAVMNVYINTKFMKNREVAMAMNEEADRLVAEGTKRLKKVYDNIYRQMTE